MAVGTNYLTAWADAASAAGDSETMLIAKRALGERIDTNMDWECGRKRAREIARMTKKGAARIAAQWGSPWPAESNPRRIKLPTKFTMMPVRVNKKGEVQIGVNPAKLGSGGRFAKCVKSVEARGGAGDPRAVCAAAGRKKYGAKKMASMARAGKKRADRRRR